MERHAVGYGLGTQGWFLGERICDNLFPWSGARSEISVEILVCNVGVILRVFYFYFFQMEVE